MSAALSLNHQHLLFFASQIAKRPGGAKNAHLTWLQEANPNALTQLLTGPFWGNSEFHQGLIR